MPNNLSILYGCSDLYSPYAGISILSLLENNRDADEITIYVAGMDISPENKDKLKQTVDGYGRKIVFLSTSAAEYKIREARCGEWNASIATWIRFFVLSQIPNNVNKLLWLDADTIVKGSLIELFNTDMSSSPIAAVCDCTALRVRYGIGFSYPDPYYNAGVLLFNLNEWRKKHIADGLLSYIHTYGSQVRCQDQDILNMFFKRSIYKLDPKYNVQGLSLAYPTDTYFRTYRWWECAYYSQEEINKAKESPIVVHFFRFLGSYPWEKQGKCHPAYALFETWRSRSLWNDIKPIKKRLSFVFVIERILYSILPQSWFLSVFENVSAIGYPSEPENSAENGL